MGNIPANDLAVVTLEPKGLEGYIKANIGILLQPNKKKESRFPFFDELLAMPLPKMRKKCPNMNVSSGEG